MARPKSPEGDWLTVSVKVRAADVALMDAARGVVSRSSFGRAAILAALNGDGSAQARPVKQRGEEAPRPVSSAPVSAGPGPEKCAHPKARILKGTCRACMTYVGK